ncbi:uncharacterized protein PHACADRAFT_202863 [Phanerochaete carnosa HHB-10118-sp]|uniref:Uncharacterized protein n=1 Tax=Phanerochaete carnosa (strain HHB-10118-sp) TaxID=650164 RepID=K5VBF0_PHACS|nr:uncharacterized protein PHACADRAFT_202863 [Phanerochaete carnosa HHB-10118-sp]EKM48398.1 hypothetical protein PHACADRAFT_202863 [Phanerochaete carnosa HHB-10118-sp]
MAARVSSDPDASLSARYFGSAFTYLNLTGASPSYLHNSPSDSPLYESEPLFGHDPNAITAALEASAALVRNGPLVTDLCIKLDKALLKRDFQAIMELWPRLQELKPATLNMLEIRPYFRNYSYKFEDLHVPQDFSDQRIHSALDDLAAHSAAASYIHGAVVQMDYHLKRREHDAALSLTLKCHYMMEARDFLLTDLLKRSKDEYASIVHASDRHSVSATPKFLALSLQFMACGIGGV